MSQHSQDGRVWAVQKSDGRKVRVHPSFLAAFPGSFKEAPSQRAKTTDANKSADQKSNTNQKEA